MALAAKLLCSPRLLSSGHIAALPFTKLARQPAGISAFRKNVSLATRATMSGSQPSRILSEDEAGLERNVRAQMLSFSGTILWDILSGLWRLPETIANILSGKESVIDEIEEKVDEAAKFVKKTAGTVETTAQEVEKVAEIVSEEADKVENLMDKVEKTSKEVKDDLTEASDDLKGAADKLKRSAEVIRSDGVTKAANSSPPSSSVSEFSSIGRPQLMVARFLGAAAVAMVWMVRDVRIASNAQLHRQIFWAFSRMMVLQAAA